MNTSGILICLFFSFLSGNTDEKIDDLFLQWNRLTLCTLEKTCNNMKQENDSSLCANRLASLPYMWSVTTDSLNRDSIRWRFLKKITTDALPLKNNWTIIELKKSGEVVRILNYVICYRESDAVVFTYRYESGSWQKVGEKNASLTRADAEIPVKRASFSRTGYQHDVIITNFSDDSLVSSIYYMPYMLRNGNRIVKLLN
ncbi:hypothetical protein Cpin_2071 [Chitinophaga pinensis DSM 2588]|uniref:Uncharacterized protein n=2 Tax=Chitinophaga pinensis TaxID=79329 RepID=A0A979G2F0_CHIPD|nr:hypothetical protein Cpin_2071 [Chitinophaga pinensis DSM 2588]